MRDFLEFAFHCMKDVWSACKWIAPALVLDVWLKQEKVNKQLNEISFKQKKVIDQLNEIEESVNELNEDDSDYSE